MPSRRAPSPESTDPWADEDWKAFRASFRGHISDEELDVDLMRSLASRPAYREALLPPDHYTHAWRLLYEVPRQRLPWDRLRPPPDEGFARNVTYRGLPDHSVSSWTVNPGLFLEDSMGFIDTSEEDLQFTGYAAVFCAKIHRQPPTFFLNPDLIYRLTGSTFGFEREVVSVRPVTGCEVAWSLAGPGDRLQDLADRCLDRIAASH